jgi:hypothetical protein
VALLDQDENAMMNIFNQDRQESVMLSEASVSPSREMLRCAQHDRLLPVLVVKIHNRVRVALLDQDEDAMMNIHKLNRYTETDIT